MPAAWVAELIGLMGELPKDLVLKKVWPKVIKEKLSPREVVAKHKIEAVSADAIREATDAAWANNPRPWPTSSAETRRPPAPSSAPS